MIKINGIKIIPTKFPDETSQVWNLETIPREAVISWYFEKEEEFLHLAQLKYLLDRYEIKSELYIDFLPYARQDKQGTNYTTFALYPFSNLLNSLNFNKITILDPHSPVATGLIKNSLSILPTIMVDHWIKQTNTDLIVYPDLGAFQKYSIHYNMDSVACDKKRNQLTGNIETIIIKGDVTNKTVMIVDDICDGGATFTKLTPMLKEKGAKEVNLFVTHGLFTKGLDVLFQSGINRIFSKRGEHYGK